MAAARADTLNPARVDYPVSCVTADELFLSLNKPKLDAAHALAADGQLDSAVLRFELLLNQLEGHLSTQSKSGTPQCEALRQYGFEVYSAYAFGLALTGEPELAGSLIQQLLNQDIQAVAPLNDQNKARLARFALRDLLPALLDNTAGQMNVAEPPLAGANPLLPQPGAAVYGNLLMRLGRESNVSFAPSRSTLNLFTDFGLIEVDLGENFRQRSGWVGLIDGQLGQRYSLPGGLDLELGAAMRMRQTAVDSGDMESLSFSGSVYGMSPKPSVESARLKDRLTLAYEVKTLFQQKVNSTELTYEYPLELQFARLEPQVSYRLVNYDFSSSNARQARLALAMIPLNVSSLKVAGWGQVDYRPGVRMEWVNDRAASPERLGGEQFEGGVGIFVQAKWGGWYGEASANSGRRASESVYSNFLLPDARLLVERSSIGLVAKKMLNSADAFVLSFQQDWQRSSIELFQSDNQGFYLGFERKF